MEPAVHRGKPPMAKVMDSIVCRWMNPSSRSFYWPPADLQWSEVEGSFNGSTIRSFWYEIVLTASDRTTKIILFPATSRRGLVRSLAWLCG